VSPANHRVSTMLKVPEESQKVEAFERGPSQAEDVQETSPATTAPTPEEHASEGFRSSEANTAADDREMQALQRISQMPATPVPTSDSEPETNNKEKQNVLQGAIGEISEIDWPAPRQAAIETLYVMAIVIGSSAFLFGLNGLLTELARELY
jgi:preprotein translocase subunit SecE